MNLHKLRKKLMNQILIFNISLVALLIIVWMTNGFDFDEFSFTASLLAPLIAVYMGVFFQFLSKKITEKEEENEEEKIIPYSNLIKRIIPIHFGAIFLVILMKALPLINIQMMNTFLVLIESMFGVGTGIILSALFDVKADS